MANISSVQINMALCDASIQVWTYAVYAYSPFPIYFLSPCPHPSIPTNFYQSHLHFLIVVKFLV